MNNMPNNPLISGLERSRDIVGLLNILMRNEGGPSMSPVSQDQTHGQGSSEEFINNLDEFVVDTEFMKKELQCSICFEDFKEGDKCILLPCQEPHTFHSSDDCSVLPWLRRKNNCPMCRCEFPRQSGQSGQSEQSVNTALTPEQISGLTYNNVEDIINPNQMSFENTITHIIGEYIRALDETVIEDGTATEDADLQRAIELSLNDI